VASRVFSAWLNRTAVVDSRLSAADLHLLRDAGERTWRYFKEWSTASTNWLIPDNVEEDGKVAMRLSPTNLGMLLNARVAAVHLELLSLADFVRDTRETLTVAEGLARYRGHFYNWYDVETLEALEPRFVSTVDSGNLAAALWTLKQAAIGFSRDPDSRCDVTPELSVELLTIAGTCDRLVSEMDFRFLFQAKRKVLSVGFNATEQRAESSSYDLLASESRIASFVAIAKGDAPQGAWFHLDRRQTLFAGCRVLVSWTGTMFEYLMPALWMRHYPDTITGQSMYAAVAVQQEYARRRGVPWGISESACTVEGGCEYGYAPFGISAIAMKRAESEALVVSPYSTLLALTVAPRAAIDNLRRMVEFGWYGRYGFYEAVDYTRSGGEIIRSWMAHHQGMGLLAIMNLLFDNRLQQYFHAEPQVMATELLLHERVPTSAVMEVEESEPATV
jgi:cyclic beta-1,2-glucan synthetase